MAVPPTIPTSFVPHPGGSDMRRSSADVTGAFGFFAYFVFALSIFSAIAVFGYDRYLAARQASAEAQLDEVARQLDQNTVGEIVQLRDRLLAGQNLLDNHIALSNFFHLVEKVIPSNVRLLQVHITIDDKGKAALTASGVAKTFNALAQTSNAFAQNDGIKDAIFSGIAVQANNTVTFSLSAALDPKLIAFTAPAQTEETQTEEMPAESTGEDQTTP